MYMHITPIVLIIFNRPDLTAQVFETIRQVKPKKLLIIADGPRNKSEEVLCQQSRAVTESIDWDCEILRNYADENLGCRNRVSSGLDWVFQQVEEAIILEDDCLPSLEFFSFCQELLETYRNDTRIWSICGHNFQDGQWRGDGSYYFSHYPDPWGWATWKRSWQHYDGDLKDWPNFHDRHLLEEVFDNSFEIEHWTQILNSLYHQNKPDSWAYRWIFTCLKNNALSIWPNVNLVSNLGFREDSTHCHQKSIFSNIAIQKINKIKHPTFTIRDKNADSYYFLHRQSGQSMIDRRRWNKRLIAKIGRLKRRVEIAIKNQTSSI